MMQVLVAVPDKEEVRPPRRTNMDASVMDRLAIKVVPGIFDQNHIEFFEDPAKLDAIVCSAAEIR